MLKFDVLLQRSLRAVTAVAVIGLAVKFSLYFLSCASCTLVISAFGTALSFVGFFFNFGRLSDFVERGYLILSSLHNYLNLGNFCEERFFEMDLLFDF